MVEFKTKVYPYCVMVYAEEDNNVKCNIARFDFDEYLTREEAIKEAENLIERYKDKQVKKDNQECLMMKYDFIDFDELEFKFHCPFLEVIMSCEADNLVLLEKDEVKELRDFLNEVLKSWEE